MSYGFASIADYADKFAVSVDSESKKAKEIRGLLANVYNQKSSISHRRQLYRKLVENDLGHVLQSTHLQLQYPLPRPWVDLDPVVAYYVYKAYGWYFLSGQHRSLLLLLTLSALLLVGSFYIIKDRVIPKLRPQNTEVFFKDVRGISEFKDELEEIVDFLKHPEKYAAAGAQIPRGVLLNGPPGSGKTLMAKAMASEAGVNFIYKSGSEFEEIYFGVGAQRVRKLFKRARQYAPCIIFIDEIDAMAVNRSQMGTSQLGCLNQLLTEMDGFVASDNVIVLAATNQLDVLDKALTRPGRFDKIIHVGYPDKDGRKDILDYYLQKIKWDEANVDLDVISRATTGFSGSQIKNLVNVAALNAVKQQRSKAVHEDFEFAIDRISMGTGKKNMHVTEKDKLLTAYHEGGHTLANLLTKGTLPLHKVTILPRGSALGYVLVDSVSPLCFLTRTSTPNQRKRCLLSSMLLWEDVLLRKSSMATKISLQDAVAIYPKLLRLRTSSSDTTVWQTASSCCQLGRRISAMVLTSSLISMSSQS